MTNNVYLKQISVDIASYLSALLLLDDIQLVIDIETKKRPDTEYFASLCDNEDWEHVCFVSL